MIIELQVFRNKDKIKNGNPKGCRFNKYYQDYYLAIGETKFPKVPKPGT